MNERRGRTSLHPRNRANPQDVKGAGVLLDRSGECRLPKFLDRVEGKPHSVDVELGRVPVWRGECELVIALELLEHLRELTARGIPELKGRFPRMACQLLADSVEKVLFGSRTKFSTTADEFRIGRREGPHRFRQKRPRTLRIGPTGLCSGGNVYESTFARFSRSFDFRLFQHYRP
jgi:hypothetical protein